MTIVGAPRYFENHKMPGTVKDLLRPGDAPTT